MRPRPPRPQTSGQGWVEAESLVIVGITENEDGIDVQDTAAIDAGANELRANPLPAMRFRDCQGR